MASLASVVRITSRKAAIWRSCAGCTELAPLAPNATHCNPCLAAPRVKRQLPRAA